MTIDASAVMILFMKTPHWKTLAAGWCLALLLAAAIPATVLADDEAPPDYDARILSYPTNVQLDGGTTALSWLALAVVGGLSVAVLFKDPKRSHLD